MSGIVYLKELKDQLQSRKFWLAAIIFYLLFTIALVNGLSYTRTHRADEQLAQKDTYEQWLNQGDKNPHAAAHYGYYAFKPTPAGAIFDKGISDYLGRFIYIEAHKQNEAKYREIQDEHSLSRSSTLTLGMIFAVFTTLIIILLGFDIISKERDMQTFKLVCSTNITMRSWVFSKFYALLSTALILTLPAYVIQAAFIMWNAPEAWFSQMLILVNLIVLYSIVAAICVTFSGSQKSGNKALVFLLILWSCAVYIVPKLGSYNANEVDRSPTSFEFSEQLKNDLRYGLDGRSSPLIRERRLKDSLLAAYKVPSIDKLPVNYIGLALLEGERFGAIVFDHHYGRLFTNFARQDQLIQLFNFLSPIALVSNSNLTLAGTDIHHQIYFANGVEQLRRKIQNILNGNYAENGKGQEFEEYTKGKDFWRTIPAYQFVPPSNSQLVTWILPSIVGSLCWLVISFTLLFSTIQKTRP